MRKQGNGLTSTFLANALSCAANAAFITDRNGRIVWVNETFCNNSGYSARETIGRTPSFLKSGKHEPTFYRELWETILSGRVWGGEIVERRKDGSILTVNEVITPLRDDSGEITHYLAIHHDITKQKLESEREHYLAYHDTLTGLPNRAMFFGSLQRALVKANSDSRWLALLYLDIDEFKNINDTYGHLIGDRLLVAVANRLRSAVRKTDLVARLGGDEFCVLQTELPDTEVASASAKKIVRNLSQLFLVEGRPVRSSVSVGIALYPDDGVRAMDLLRNADRAMYESKKLGRNRYQFFHRHTESQPA